MAFFRYSMLGRLFLLSLLALEWAADPYNGRSLLSAPLSSQLVIDQTIGIRPSLGEQEPAPTALDNPLQTGDLSQCSPSPQPSQREGTFFTPSATNLIYYLMLLLR
jgi:hypothetical protein